MRRAVRISHSSYNGNYNVLQKAFDANDNVFLTSVTELRIYFAREDV